MATSVVLDDEGLLDPTPCAAVAAITKCNSLKSSLLRIPIELRLKIYGHVLGRKTIHIKTWNKRYVCATIKPYTEPSEISRSFCYNDYDEKMVVWHYLNVISVCRQTYAEARHLAFALNTLCIDPAYTALHLIEEKPWMPVVSKLQTWCSPLYYDREQFDCLRCLPGLQHIEIGGATDSFRGRLCSISKKGLGEYGVGANRSKHGCGDPCSLHLLRWRQIRFFNDHELENSRSVTYNMVKTYAQRLEYANGG